MHNQCVVSNCTSGKSDPQYLFRFPRDPERCKKWVEKCQRQDLADKPPDQLYRYYRLCGKHFDTSAFDSVSPVLKDDAIPTIFDLTNHHILHMSLVAYFFVEMKKSPAEPAKDDVQTAPEEDPYKEYLKSLFEVLLLLGAQNIPPTGPRDDKQDNLKSSNFQALLDYRMNSGDEVLKKMCGENTEGFSTERLNQLIEVCEKSIRGELVKEINQNGFFSLLTDDLVKISGEWFLPVFLRFMDQSNCQRERFLGFLSFEGNGDALAEKLLSEITDTWGLNMDQCRGQAHASSRVHFIKIKAFAAKITEKYPAAGLTLKSTETLNVSLANGIALSGVQLVMSTFKKIESFFKNTPLLQVELEHAISIFYPDKEEKANELKEICRTSWTRGNNAFEVAVEILEAMLLCVDSVHDNEDMRWSDQAAHDALEISKALTDFEFVIALVVLKNTMTLTRAFGKNIQGSTADLHFAASSLKAVAHSLKEVSDNIDVYHEFWYDEAINLVAALEIPVKVPRSFVRKHHTESLSILPESYYKEHLTVPVVNHVIREMNELFSDDSLKALRCLGLVPAIIEHYKTTEPEEDSVQVFKNDIPNAGTLSAELHCWWVKWSKKGKGESLPSTLGETLQLADVKFFPNVLAVLRLIGIVPTLALEDNSDVAYKSFKTYMENTPDKFKSKTIALLNINSDVGCDLDSMVELYMNTYPERDQGQGQSS
uniref:THAP domain containing 12a n=1 Tax=Sphaeramia orbicularis TaxID=375764 RepID=A0A672YLK2_9TELE